MYKLRKTSSLLVFILIILGGSLYLSGVLADEDTRPLPVYQEIRRANQSKQADFIASYGLSEFYRCYACAGDNLNNPFAVARCLRETEFCLFKKTIPNIICKDGYTPSVGRCVTLDQGCREQYGENGRYLGYSENEKYACGCRNGYTWNNNRSQCVQTACPDGYIFYSSYRYFDDSFMHGRCMTRDNACQSEYGEFSRFNRISEDGGYLCGCASGYDWNEHGTACDIEIIVRGISGPGGDELIYLNTIDREATAAGDIDINLSARLKGRILLQVEENGEAWYIDPDDLRRYFLSSPAKAFSVMRELGLGATHNFLTTHTIYPERVWGKILIDVDDLGRAYYINPENGLAYYLGSPAEAYGVMRELGLGISNDDLRKIKIGN